MKVLIANKYLYAKAGAETVMLQEREYLTRRGIDVIDFSMSNSNNLPSDYSEFFVSPKEYRQGSRFDRVLSALSLVHSREAVRKFVELIDHAHPDLIHCHNIYHQLTPSIINAAKKRGIPVVLTVHDLKPVCPTRSRVRHGLPCSLCFGGSFHHVVRHRCADGSITHSTLLYAEATIQRWLGSYENVDCMLSPSRYVRDSLLARFPSEQIALLYNGVDTETIKPTGHDHGYVLYFGRVTSGKGIEMLLKAHEITDYAWPITIAGTGPLFDALSSRPIRNVQFTGHLSGDQLADVVANAALVVAPSTMPENCPMSVLEAMAYGKPVIGTRRGGTPELVEDGITGILFDGEDGIELARHLDRLMSDRTLRTQMGQQARRRTETLFSLEHHNAALMEIYRTVMANQSAVRAA